MERMDEDTTQEREQTERQQLLAAGVDPALLDTAPETGTSAWQRALRLGAQVAPGNLRGDPRDS